MKVGEKLIINDSLLNKYRYADANYILSVLRSPIAEFWSWGGHAFTDLNGHGLRFKSEGFKHKGHVYILLNGADLFDVILTTTHGKIVAIETDIHVDGLHDAVDNLIEFTGDSYEGLVKGYAAETTDYPDEPDPDNFLTEKISVTMDSKILRDNLAAALRIAIDQQSRIEKMNMYRTDSAFLAGLRKNYETVISGGQLTIVE